MNSLADWLPQAVVGVSFTTMGLLKVYGFRKGIVGGAGKPASCRLMGTCPSWSRHVNVAMVVLFFGIGLGSLGILLVRLLKS